MEDSPYNSEDLNYLKDLIGKSIQVETADGEMHKGNVYVIDPISKTIILTSAGSVSVIMNHALKTFEVISDSVEHDRRETLLMGGNEVEHRKRRLKDWLKKNLIDVKEDGSLLKIQDSVQIGPPYTIDQCSCSNRIILERIVSIIDRMPECN